MAQRIAVFDSESGVSRVVVIYPGIEVSDLKDLLFACFSTNVIGIKDLNSDDGVVYPLSLVTRLPQLLAGNDKRLITVTESPSNSYLDPIQPLQRQMATTNLHEEQLYCQPVMSQQKQKRFYQREDSSLQEEKSSLGTETNMPNSSRGKRVPYVLGSPGEGKVLRDYGNGMMIYETDSSNSESESSESDEENDRSADNFHSMIDEPFSLEQSIVEVQLITGLDKAAVRMILELIPLNTTHKHKIYAWFIEALPETIDRQTFLELMNDLASILRGGSNSTESNYIGPPPDEPMLNLLFDVLAQSSQEFNDSDDDGRTLADTLDIPTFASGLSLLCGDVHQFTSKENLRVVFSLYAKQSNSGTAVVPEVALFLHLSTLLRLVFQLCNSLRHAAGCTPEDLAYEISLNVLSGLAPSTDGCLGFNEFYLACFEGFKLALEGLHNSSQMQLRELIREQYSEDYVDEEQEQVQSGDDATSSSTHDKYFEEGTPGLDFWENSSENASSEERSDHDMHFPHGERGVDYFHHGDHGNQGNAGNRTDPLEEESEDDEDNSGSGSGNPLEDSLIAASLVEFDGGPIDLGKAQQLLGLKTLSPDEMLSSLVFSCNEDGMIPLSSYHRLIDQLIGRHYTSLSVLQRSVVDYIVSSLFECYDEQSRGEIRLEELGWALLVFTDGSSTDKAGAATSLLNSCKDLTQQGGVSSDDMIYALASVLQAVVAVNPQFLVPLSPHEVSIELTDYALEATESTNDILSVEEFEHWFSRVIAQFDLELDDLSRGSQSLASLSMGEIGEGLQSEASELRSSICSGNSEDISEASIDTNEWVQEIRRNKRAAGQSRLAASKLVIQTKFDEEQGSQQESTGVDEVDNHDGIDIDTDGETEDDADPKALVHPADQFFLNYDDYYNTHDVSFDADIDDSLKSLDVDDLNEEDMEMYRNYQNYQLHQGQDDGSASQSQSASDIPSQSQSQSSSEYSRGEMYYEYDDDEYVLSGFGGEESNSSCEQGSSNNQVMNELREAREILKLDGFPAEDLMEVIGDFAKEGRLIRSKWMEALRHVVLLSGGNKTAALHTAYNLGHQIFDVFYFPSQNIQGDNMRTTHDSVSYYAFSAGLSCLCSSSLHDKVQVAHTLFDDDLDGYVTHDQFRQLVLAVLSTVYACSQYARRKISEKGLSLTVLARALTGEVTKTYGVDRNDPLTLDTILLVCSDYAHLSSHSVF